MKYLIICFFVLFSYSSFAEGPPWKRVNAISVNPSGIGFSLYQGLAETMIEGPFYYELFHQSGAMNLVLLIALRQWPEECLFLKMKTVMSQRKVNRHARKFL